MFSFIRCIVFLFVLQNSFSVQGQIWDAKWKNKDKSTYTISFSIMGTRVEDTAKCGVFIKMYELTEEGCKPIEGEAKINDKMYDVYDSTGYLDEDGEKMYWKYFGVLLPEDIYSIKAYAGKGFYQIKTEQYNLLRRTAYTFYFYFVRKDALKRN